MMDWTTITTATLGATATITAAFFGYLASRRQKQRASVALDEAKTAKEEIELARVQLDFGLFAGAWDQTVRDIQELMEETNVDRFLLLRALNGKDDPRYTNAVLQIRERGQHVIQYLGVVLDIDYVGRLKEVESNGSAYYVVSDMPPCVIRSIYEAEGVKAAEWCFIHRENYDDSRAVITYCSFATHSTEGFDDATRALCKLRADRIAQNARMFKTRLPEV